VGGPPAQIILQHPAEDYKDKTFKGECGWALPAQNLKQLSLSFKNKKGQLINCPNQEYLNISFKTEDHLRAPGYRLKKGPQSYCRRREHEIGKKSYHFLRY
jgi:hypothetical protein